MSLSSQKDKYIKLCFPDKYISNTIIWLNGNKFIYFLNFVILVNTLDLIVSKETLEKFWIEGGNTKKILFSLPNLAFLLSPHSVGLSLYVRIFLSLFLCLSVPNILVHHWPLDGTTPVKESPTLAIPPPNSTNCTNLKTSSYSRVQDCTMVHWQTVQVCSARWLSPTCSRVTWQGHSNNC